MVMSWIWTGLVLMSILCSVCTDSGKALGAAAMEGAQSAVTLIISMGGAICLWTGTGRLMEKAGITELLSRLLRPILHRVFPSSAVNPQLAGALSGNICANILGLGNAATPMGISAARLLTDPNQPGYATDELCRLIVLNTASIQLLPTNVAALRAALGCSTPFDILPAVWSTSLLSAGFGLCAARCLGKLWKG